MTEAELRISCAALLAAVHIVPFPVIGSVAEYLEWFGLVAS